jgi:hypothetical protein
MTVNINDYIYLLKIKIVNSLNNNNNNNNKQGVSMSIHSANPYYGKRMNIERCFEVANDYYLGKVSAKGNKLDVARIKYAFNSVQSFLEPSEREGKFFLHNLQATCDKINRKDLYNELTNEMILPKVTSRR